MSIIAPIYKSIVRATSDLITDLNSLNRWTEIGYFNFETRHDPDKLPQMTLPGPDGFSFEENEGRWIIRLAMALSSYRDLDLLNEIEILDAIHERWGEKKKIPLREMTNGEEVSELVVARWQLMPMSESELRNYRVMGMELLRTGV